MSYTASLFTVTILSVLMTTAYAYRIHSLLRRSKAEILAARGIIEEMSHDHWTFLAVASRTLTSSLDYKHTLTRVSLLPIPDLADACEVHMLEDDGSITLAVNGTDSKGLNVESGISAVNKTQISSNIQEVLSRAKSHTINSSGSATIIIPLRSRNLIIGTMTLESHRAGFAYTASHQKLAEQLASIAALAIDNARLYDRAQQEIKARERTVALVSHDMKNPLCAIDVSAQLLTAAMGTSTELSKFKRHVQLIHNACTHMDGLIRNLLDAAKIKSGTFQIDKEQVALSTLLREYIDFAKTLALPKNIEITLDAPIEDQTILVDRETMFRAFSNVMGNAIKFTPNGGRVTMKVVPDSANGVRFTVADSGPGIAPDDLPHVFDDFWQAQSTAKLGTGLGLTIAKGIVEAHGGRIWAEPSPEGGASFAFTTGPSGNA